MTRNDFLKAVSVTVAAGELAAQPQPQASATNEAFELVLTPGKGLKARLTHQPSTTVLADGTYSYSFGELQFEKTSRTREGQNSVVILEGATGTGLEVRQEFSVPESRPWIEERITVTNRSHHPLAVPYARCGFVLPIPMDAGKAGGPLKDFKFIAVPYRREPRGDRKQYADFTLTQVLLEPRSSRLRSDIQLEFQGDTVIPAMWTTGPIQTEFEEYASEGWLLTDGTRGFLITKFNPSSMEWALLDRIPLNEKSLGLRWGGFGVFRGDPEHAAWLGPGASYRFGRTRITAVAGGIPEGFYAFRSEMEGRGMGCPKGFNPPAHWNELYDNKLWWIPNNGQDNDKNRQELYRLEHMKEEAAKARDYHCEALYMDPGWDTSFASKIWDESRLGKASDFVALLKKEYGLSVSLHTPMSGWCNPTSYSRDTDRMRRDGSRVKMSLCGASRQYVEETFRRLDTLARDGVTFFMFDGTIYHGECWDPNHGHPIPSRRHEHVEAMSRLARMVHEHHPRVLIEMHDQVVGGSTLRYVPTYYGYGAPPPGYKGPNALGFDTVWAYELMWDPMTDLVGGHSIALYYYNLAYSVPLYIHIDLRKDNPQSLMLWWNISTCRHLGLGGSHSDPEAQNSHKKAMAEYRRLKPFFAAGVFYGIDELTHVHRHPTEQALVINCFNLEPEKAQRTFHLEPTRFGMAPGRSYKVSGGAATKTAGGYEIDVVVAGYGHTLVEVISGG
jgi:hypothetical protein